jgi:hypothetical protein
MASITWTDDDGTVTLDNGLPAPGNRFQGWEPSPEPVGPMHYALGTQIPYKYLHARSYTAKFAMERIPSSREDDCQRLIDHLKSAGIVTIATDDINNAGYDCYLAPGATPSLSKPDPKDLRRTLALELINSVAVRMTCIYT